MRTKRWVSLLLCLLFCVTLFPMAALADGDRYLEINGANFPDATFRQYIKTIKADGKDYMTKAEVDAVTTIDVNHKGISSLVGIEHFSALEALYCDGNQLTVLDVSHNTVLEELWCSDNKLTTLDVSHNSALEQLWCSDNKLTTLDMSHITALESLSCSNNQFRSLNVSHNTALEYLSCLNNKLTTLDVSHNTVLKSLNCSNNLLTTLDMSHNGALEELWCNDNQLTTLDVSKNTLLEILYCYSNHLTTLGVGHNTTLEELYCSDNKLATLDVSHNTALEYLDCSYNQLTALDASKNTALESLDCSDNKLTTLNVSKNTALDSLRCSNNKLTTLDVSQNVFLKHLSCCENKLTTLNVNKNTELTYLDCDSNKLTALDVSHNTALEYLSCSNNKLTTLDVSCNTALEELCCSGNKLATLELRANTVLTYIYVDGQTILGQSLAFANGSYWYDLSKLVPLANMARVTVTGDGQLDKATGKVTFTKKVYNFTYQYATGHGAMDVTVSFANADDLIVPPTITTQPKDITVKSGEEATFTVEAEGEGNIEYQWYSRPNANAKWTVVNGAKADTYTVTGTRDNNGWQFCCRVKNEGGEVYSNAATLTVITAAPPTIKTQPKDAKVKSGSKAKFAVKAKEKDVTYQWFVRASAKDEWQEMKGETKDKLTVVGTGANNGWQYRCRLRNKAGGEAYSNIATLTVTLQKPVIKTQPKDLSVKSGKKVKFSVKASGKNITYQWFTRANAESEWQPVAGGNKKDLNVIASKANNGSQYYCYLKNADGDATSVTVTLTVTPEAPTIKTQPKDAKVKIGGKAKFKVKASGKNVTYQWYYRTSEAGEWVLLEGATKDKYEVKVTAEMIGWQFRCLAKNADGQVYSKAATLRKK